MGAAVVPLSVSVPFHTALMRPAAEKLYRTVLSKYTYSNPKWKVISNVTARPYEGERDIAEILTKQMVNPVRWTETMRYLADNGADVTVELGPGNILSSLVKHNNLDIPSIQFDSRASVGLYKDTIGKIEHKADLSCISFAQRSLGIIVSTKNHNWNNAEYTKGVLEPYSKIEKLSEQLDRENARPDKEQMLYIINCIKTVFKTKKVPIAERKERFKQLFEETGYDGYLEYLDI